MKSCAAGLDVRIRQIFFVGEGDGVNQYIESAPGLPQVRKYFFDFFVLGHVARQNDFRTDAFGQRANALLQHFSRIRERQLGALGMKRLGNRPSDTALIGDTEDRSEERRVGKGCRSRWSS